MWHWQIKNCCFHYKADLKQNFLSELENLIEYSASVLSVIEVLSNLCAGPLLRTNISLFLLSIWADELLPTPKITRKLLQSKFWNQEGKWESKLMSYS